MTAASVRPSPSARRWWLLAAGVTVISAATGMWLATDDGSTRTSTATTEILTATSSTTSTTPVPTTITIDDDVRQLAAHQWVRLPIDDEPFMLSTEPTLTFHENGTVEGHTGCEHWVATVHLGALGAGRFEFATLAARDSICSTLQVERLANADLRVSTADGTTTLTIEPPGGSPPIDYIAADSLSAVDAAGLVGSWQQRGRARLTFNTDGGLQIGGCSTQAAWSLNDDVLSATVETDDTALAAACAGAPLAYDAAGAPTPDLASSLTLHPLQCTVATFRDVLLTQCDGTTADAADAGSGYRWLHRAVATEPAVDLIRGTAFGFAVATDAPADSVIGEITGQAGAPRFDSGWYTSYRVPTGGEEDCFGGLPMRLVQWADVTVVWMRLGADSSFERLWVIDIGRTDGVDGGIATSLARTVRYEGALPTFDGNGLSTPAMGSSIDDFMTVGLSLHDFRDDRGNAADPDDAVWALATTTMGSGYAVVRLDHGTVAGVSIVNPGFC